MKTSVYMLTAGLALGVGGLAVFLNAQQPEPPARAAEAPPRTAASKVVHVTVYPNSALVTREVDAPAGKGTMELVVNPLPEQTLHDSLYSEGSDAIRVMSTRFRTRAIQEDTREEVRKVEDEIRKLRHEAQRIEAAMQSCNQNRELLGKLENFTSASTQHATEKGALNSDTTIALAKYLMDGRSEKSREMVELQQQQEKNQEQAEFLNRKLAEMTSGTSRTERDAVIVVEKTEAAPGKVRLNYLVGNASWRPQYKFRAGKDAKMPVQVEYLAAIMQQTGEDWSHVNLVLSTAQPMLNAAPPDLMMLAVNVVPRGAQVTANVPLPPMTEGNREQLSQLAQNLNPNQDAQAQGNLFSVPSSEPGQTKEAFKSLTEQVKKVREIAQEEVNKRNDAKDIINYAGTLEQARDLVLAAEETGGRHGLMKRSGSQNEGPSVTYHLKNNLTVPSRNDEQVIEVARLDMAPDYFYKAVPVLTPHIYRQANLVNKSAHVLLPGEATMYNDVDFVGRMNLPLVAIGEQFTVGFGTEPQLQVQRLMTDKTRTQQGGNQVLSFQYRILVNSYKTERVKLQLWDRLPHAENETMGITLVKATPETSQDALYMREDKPSNLLRWDLDIDPDMNGEKAREVSYHFKLELDRQMSIGSFQSK